MRYIYYKNIQNILKFKKLEFFKVFYKSLFFSLSLTNYIRSYFYTKLILFFKKYNFFFIRSRCVFNLYSRNLIKKYNLSRFMFKFYANNGYITGIRRL